MVCAAARSAAAIRAADRLVIPTADPEATGERLGRWLRSVTTEAPVDAVGIASFGPLDLASGRIGRTPKPGWEGFSWPDLVDRWVPGATVAVETDTNAAALAEDRHGAAAGRDPAVYLTVGTGVGGGVVVAGRLLHGLGHPELGHMRVPRHPADTLSGVCPYHGDCLEGLASGPAVAARWGADGATLEVSSPAWEMEAYYLGTAVANVVLTLAPEVVVLGGGVLDAPGLLQRVRSTVVETLGGYIADGRLTPEGIEGLVVRPALGRAAGVVGAYEIASDRLREALRARS